MFAVFTHNLHTNVIFDHVADIRSGSNNIFFIIILQNILVATERYYLNVYTLTRFVQLIDVALKSFITIALLSIAYKHFNFTCCEYLAGLLWSEIPINIHE